MYKKAVYQIERIILCQQIKQLGSGYETRQKTGLLHYLKQNKYRIIVTAGLHSIPGISTLEYFVIFGTIVNCRFHIYVNL